MNRLRSQPHYSPPLFPTHMWSVYENNNLGFPRTQNKVEAWHRRWNTLVGNTHVGVYKIINHIKNEQNRTELEIIHFNNNGKVILVRVIVI